MKNGVRFSVVCGVACAAVAPQFALSQLYPAKPIRLMVPQSAGSATDTVARAIAQKLGERVGQQVIIDNRAGASGLIAGEMVAKAPPDGYTLLIVSATHTVNPSLRKSMPYDAIRDFTPVTLATGQSYVLLAHPSLPVKNVKELVQLAKARPGQINYASTAAGSLGHLGFELLKTTAGIDMVHITYKGTGPALTDIMGGHVSLLFLTVVSGLPQVKAGRLKGLAVSTGRRSPIAPDIPTMAESGVLPGFDVSGWYGILGPANLPPVVTGKLNSEIAAILKTPEIRERLAADGSEAVGSTPDAFAAHLKTEVAKWAKVVKAAGIKPE
ncbi:MAG: tripartite tricarboxylate transporter substrate binding protein [Burkholderiales bacterium]